MATQAWRIAKLTALACLISTSSLASVDRPDPLAQQANCDSFQGTALEANDPTQLFEVRLCPSPTGVDARVQTSSLVSGYSVRVGEGNWDPTGRTLTLKETRFLDNRPEPGWRFCLIDTLTLTKTATGLAGNYVSVACDDSAELTLEALAPASVTPTSVTPTSVTPTSVTPPASPTPKPEPPAAKPEPPTACACSSGGERGSSPAPMLLVFGLLLVGRRRRS